MPLSLPMATRPTLALRRGAVAVLLLAMSCTGDAGPSPAGAARSATSTIRGASDPLPTSAECERAAESSIEDDPHLSVEDPDPHPWETATPRQVGLDDELLAEAASNVGLSARAASFLVIRHGKLVFERYFNGSDAAEANTLASLSKSILSLLVGTAVDRNELTPDTPISRFLPNDLLPRDDGLTVRHLLTMSSGLEWDENEDSDVLDVRGTLERDRVSAPGAAFNYNTGLTHVLSAVVTQATGRSTCDATRDRLFGPLGVTADHWAIRPDGYFTGGDSLWLTPREIARFGQLVLQHGAWNGTQVVPGPWIDASMSKAWDFGCTDDFKGRQAAPGGAAYGYLWWLSEADGVRVWSAQGFGGQYLMIVPELDLVVVLTQHVWPEGDEAPVPGLRLLRFFVLPAAGHRVTSADDECPGPDIFRIRADGSRLEQLTADGSVDIPQSWSPDGERVAIHSDRDLNFEVYTMAADGTDVRRLTRAGRTDGFPAWSPDGRTILFASDRGASFDIYCMDADGSHVRLLVDAPTDELAPIWSPDGRSIAFVSNAKGDVDGELWAADADGSHRRRLHEGPVTFADWSPDGTRIAFSGPVSGEHRVSVLDIASGETTDLGPGELPRWSPDGARLAVSTADFTAIEIIRVADQRRVRLVTGIVGGASIWSPDGEWVTFSSSRPPSR